MELNQAYLKHKTNNSTFYQFKNEEGCISTLEVSKLKSGYEVTFNGPNDYFFRTDGVKNIEGVKKAVEKLSF